MKYILERFEGNIAVLEDEKLNMHNIPLKCLPPEVKQGDTIIYDEQGSVFTIDKNATSSRTQYINSLFEKLKNRKDISKNED